jgi:hypothetical protein
MASAPPKVLISYSHDSTEDEEFMATSARTTALRQLDAQINPYIRIKRKNRHDANP